MVSTVHDRSTMQRQLLMLLGCDAQLHRHATFVENGSWRVEYAHDGYEALRQFEIESPSLLVASSELPAGPSGLEICRSLKSRSSSSGAIILVRGGTVEERLSAFDAKADDCVDQPLDVREFAARANALAVRCAFPPPFAAKCDDAKRDAHGLPSSVLPRRVLAFSSRHGLSQQQSQILRLLVSGVPVKLIGSRVGCEHSTVRTHLRRIGLKLGCSGTREILTYLLSSEVI